MCQSLERTNAGVYFRRPKECSIVSYVLYISNDVIRGKEKTLGKITWKHKAQAQALESNRSM